jgi:hypothetical protein
MIDNSPAARRRGSKLGAWRRRARNVVNVLLPDLVFVRCRWRRLWLVRGRWASRPCLPLASRMRPVKGSGDAPGRRWCVERLRGGLGSRGHGQPGRCMDAGPWGRCLRGGRMRVVGRRWGCRRGGGGPAEAAEVDVEYVRDLPTDPFSVARSKAVRPPPSADQQAKPWHFALKIARPTQTGVMRVVLG